METSRLPPCFPFRNRLPRDKKQKTRSEDMPRVLQNSFLLWQPGYPGDLQSQIKLSWPLSFYLKAKKPFLGSPGPWLSPSDCSKLALSAKMFNKVYYFFIEQI